MEHSIYVNAIKKALKSRGVSYAELAQDLRMTESGVKKMLTAKDISFRRILQICEVLDILPGQLFSSSEKSRIKEVELSNAQQEALIKNRSLLAVYWRFVVEKYSLDEISKMQNLSKAETKKLMDRLVTLDLLVQTRGQYRATHAGKFKWSDTSKLAKFLNQEWSELTLQRALKNPTATHRLIGLKLSPASYQRWIEKMQTALDEVVQESERDELTLAKKDLQHYSLLLAAVPQGVFDPEV